MKALEAAKYIIKSIQVDNLKLQKLLFYSQAVSLVKYKDPLFPDRIEAWPYGPVVPSVYKKYKNNDLSILRVQDEIAAISPDSMHAINLVLGFYGEMSGVRLISETHSEKPWKEAYTRGRGTEITKQAIEDYYRTILVFENGE